MAALLGFAPFIAFALVEKFLGITAGLVCAALVSLALSAHNWWRGERELDLLEMAGALMFTALAGAALAGKGAAWDLWQVRLWVDAGLLIGVVLSIAARRPFTMRYARRQVSADVARSPGFLRANCHVSAVWALAFTLLAAADALMIVRPQTPVVIAVAMTVGALGAAAWFTRWYAGLKR